jgi:hypothetical protein
MTAPSGEIVERVMLARACGCVQEFQHYSVDRYRAGRRAKFQSTRCPQCAAKVSEGQRVVSKVEAFRLLPTGAQFVMTRAADGTWAGTLTAGGITLEADAAGPQALCAALAQLWTVQQPGAVGQAKP